MSSSRFAKSSLLKTSIISKFKASIEEEPHIGNIQSNVSNDEEYLFMHILDCMGALSCIRADQKAKNDNDDGGEVLRSKYRVFWRTVREIAEQEALLADNKQTIATSTPIPKNEPFNFVLNTFPDDSKLSDGRMWLPLHFAVSLPNISLADIETLFTAHPAAIKELTNKIEKFNPCHLAAMMNNPRLEVIQQLKIFYPRFGVSLASESYTPLHLAARYSNSVAMVRELVELHPAALGAEDSMWDTPLHVAARYSNSVAIVQELAQLHPAALSRTNANGDTPLSSVASQIPSGTLGKLQMLLDAAPQAARMANTEFYNCLPLHQILNRGYSPPATPEMVAIVLAAYRDAVNIPDDDGWLPIHYAARYTSVDALKMIAEENMSHLSLVLPEIGSLAHSAVRGCSLDNLQYIHSKVPDILMTVDSFNDNTPLHGLLNGDLMESLKNLRSPLSAASDILRYLLRHCPSLATAKNSDQQTLYDLLPAEYVGLAYASRLLLLAGASSLYPGALQELNYAARREALLLFYSAAPPTQQQRSIISRIRYGAGGTELMRTIVCFL